MGNIDYTEFERVKKQMLMLTPKQRKELKRLIEFDPAGGMTRMETVTDTNSFHKQLQQVLNERSGAPPPPLSNLKRSNPHLHRRIDAVEKELHSSIPRLFPKVTKTQFLALRLYFIRMAANRVEDLEQPVTLSLVLDALAVLEELIDDQLPGYRASGILQQVILNKISGSEQCLGKTR